MKISNLFNLSKAINVFSYVFLFVTFVSCSKLENYNARSDNEAIQKSNIIQSACNINGYLNDTTIDFGISRTELPWANGGMSAQLAMLDSIKSVGVECIRLSLSRANLRDEVRDHILYANQIGLNVLVMLKIGAIDELYPPGVVKRSGEGRYWDQYPQSKIDFGLFHDWVNDLLNYWKNAGCQIDVIEVSNEFAWVDFNGDFPVMPLGQGVIYDTTYHWLDLPFDVRWGVRKVGAYTKITRDIAQKIFGANAPTVILGGLNAPFNPQWIVNKGGSIMVPELALKIIKGAAPGQPSGHINYLDSIDGIAVHLYPSSNDCSYKTNCFSMVSDAQTFIDKFMGPVNDVTNLPVYLTEVGYPVSIYGANQDWKRTKILKAFFTAIENTKNMYNWEKVYVYSWDQGNKRLVRTNGVKLYSAKHLFQ